MEYRYLPSEDIAFTVALEIAGRYKSKVAGDSSEFFGLGLSGGKSPFPMYQHLSKHLNNPHHLRIFLVDERYVPTSHDESNLRSLKEYLPAFTNDPSSEFVAPSTLLPFEGALEQWSKQLEAHPPLDLIVLGIGSDGHTASLFSDYWNTPSPFVVGTQRIINGAARLSMSYPYLLSAKELFFYVPGVEKRAVRRELFSAISQGPAASLLYHHPKVTLFHDDPSLI